MLENPIWGLLLLSVHVLKVGVFSFGSVSEFAAFFMGDFNVSCVCGRRKLMNCMEINDESIRSSFNNCFFFFFCMHLFALLLLRVVYAPSVDLCEKVDDIDKENENEISCRSYLLGLCVWMWTRS
ncbi:hypothetical protein Ddye_024849 [Dipteronia dyeriana]|uniref:Transmembrane protein n=1 Tax=Dipteronia dyeriana TaxID=168575 RepID=A0AAD9TW69_9ROSI|nr:hypothetical protein Ddye_024849 [Dipteronia dyeriana]